jgi:hypothetical protein
MDGLSIRTLGRAEVSLGGQPVQWRAESARTLVFYLLTPIRVAGAALRSSALSGTLGRKDGPSVTLVSPTVAYS